MYIVWSIWTDREQGSLKAPATSENHCLDFTDMPVSLIIIIIIIIIFIIIIVIIIIIIIIIII